MKIYKHKCKLITFLPDIVCGPPNCGKEEGADISKDFSMKTRLTHEHVPDYMESHGAQKLSHVLREKGQVKIGSQCKGKQRISESSESALCNCGWTKNLIGKFLFGFVCELAAITKVISET